MKLEFFFFSRYLISNKKYSLVNFINLLSFTSIFISVIIFLLTASISNGFLLKLESNIFGFDPHIIVLCNEIGENIKSIKKNKIFINNNIESINFTFYSQVFLKSNKGFFNALLKIGVFQNRQTSNLKTYRIKKKLTKKDIHDSIAPVILGTLLSKKIDIIVGEIVYITPSILNNEMPFFLPFRVVGLLHTGIQNYDELLVCINSENCSDLFHSQYEPKYAEIILKDISRIENASKKIKNSIGHKFLVKNLIQINADFFWILKLQKTIIILILFIITIISTSIISASFLIMFLEKFSEISILKIIGFNNFKIRTIFITKLIFLVLIACQFSYFFGFFICFLLKYSNMNNLTIFEYFFTTLPFYATALNVIFVLLATVLLSLFFSFISSLKISSVQFKKNI